MIHVEISVEATNLLLLLLLLLQEFLDPNAARELATAQPYNFILDCIDSIAPKQHLILSAVAQGIPVVSSMGAGGRLDPSRIKVADISESYNDPFAAHIRRGLRKKGVRSGVTVVFSDELAKKSSLALTDQQYKKSYYGTISYIPALFGLHMAAHVVQSVVDPTGYKPAMVKSPSSTVHKKQSSSNSSSGSSKKKGRSRLETFDDRSSSDGTGKAGSSNVGDSNHANDGLTATCSSNGGSSSSSSRREQAHGHCDVPDEEVYSSSSNSRGGNDLLVPAGCANGDSAPLGELVTWLSDEDLGNGEKDVEVMSSGADLGGGVAEFKNSISSSSSEKGSGAEWRGPARTGLAATVNFGDAEANVNKEHLDLSEGHSKTIELFRGIQHAARPGMGYDGSGI